MNRKLIELPYSGLLKVISGGQTGADQAGLFCARYAGIATGGSISKGFRTSLGPAPYLADFNLIESSSPAYPPRTKDNAFNSDATVRLASNFNTAGEVLTLRYATAAKKPCLSLLLNGKDYDKKAEELVEFLINYSVTCLNVAGNADRDTQFGFHFTNAAQILTTAFQILDNQGLLLRNTQ